FFPIIIHFEKEKTLAKCKSQKSDRRGSNPRSRPWQGRALPTTPLSHIKFCLRTFIRSSRQMLFYYMREDLSNGFLSFWVLFSSLWFILDIKGNTLHLKREKIPKGSK